MYDEERRVYGVSELTALVRELLEGGFPAVTVEGEITNCRPASSGHLYFSLKDRQSMLQAVMFRYRTRGLGFEPTDGMLVRARGAITVYAARGQYQLLCEGLERAGEGDLLAMLEARKRRLAAEGLFDEARKRPLPRFPERVCVVTSPTGAAVRDIINVLARRNAGLELRILPAAVQGEAAPAEIVAQIERANRFALGDVIIVGRGGGSLEDLLAFSDEAVVRAVAASRIPVVSAVGHEIDWALTDFAADLRAPTPSAAAELVSESREALKREVAQLSGELGTAIRSRLDRARFLLSRFEPQAVEGRFMRLLHPAIRRVDEARDALVEGMRGRTGEARHRIALALGTLEASSPEAVLARGFAVVRRLPAGAGAPAGGRLGAGEALRDAAGLAPGELLDIRFSQGGATARVEEVKA
ncbi:MAG: exodeoxyribonuclease VII large subunit [Spirochaetaceae bacterium]|nr:exodeoxyribonuclease VII large subunit [Spirochaetaceae bacterium]